MTNWYTQTKNQQNSIFADARWQHPAVKENDDDLISTPWQSCKVGCHFHIERQRVISNQLFIESPYRSCAPFLFFKACFLQPRRGAASLVSREYYRSTPMPIHLRAFNAIVGEQSDRLSRTSRSAQSTVSQDPLGRRPPHQACLSLYSRAKIPDQKTYRVSQHRNDANVRSVDANEIFVWCRNERCNPRL